ncbi:hypothetical protein K458DRAFT_383667 [Lentithecium fluviatile CBS 122367]|uniref:Uncharacterized protein n=1 Tax=Lentithecium fluviatile CBS 122367 TaxID=1168545 RepID=A0A6G1JK10_9PLEO|nr:hypothetical protein K458DRAFT_383667 [Lentithecium fluviatile CBS 122367]
MLEKREYEAPLRIYTLLPDVGVNVASSHSFHQFSQTIRAKMKTVLGYAALAAALCFGATHAQDLTDKPKACPCYTATAYETNNGCPAFEPTKPCIVPMCLRLTTTTIPGPNTRCPKTPTITSYLPCQTACPTGCAGTSTVTLTHSSSCLPTTPTTITKPTPTKPTTQPTLTPILSSTVPTSISTRTRPCYTRTVPATKKCPEDALGCPPPDCLYLSTTTVPSGPVKGCPTTKTVVADRTCLGRCDGACGTQWVTETATAWKR